MAEKISVQIALEGGAEVQRQLEGIGEAGQKAFSDISKSAEQVGGFRNLKPEEVTAKLNQLGIAGTEAFDKIQQAVKTAVKFENVVSGVQSVENAFVNLAKVAGVVGIGVAAAFAAMVKPTLAFAEAISQADQEAIKLGLTIEQFDKLRQGLEAAGLSAKAISSGIATLKENLDKLDLATVKKAFDELADAATRGFGAQGTAQLKLLQEAAKGVGPAAEEARKALEKLGLPIPDAAKSALEQLGIAAGTVAERLPEVVEKLRQMPDSAQRSALAIQLFGQAAGSELVQALRTGGVAIDQFIAKQGQLTQEQANTANALEQAINRLSAAWGRFNSLAIAPALTEGINFATRAVEALTRALQGLQQIGQSDIGKGIRDTLQNAFTGLDQIIFGVVNAIQQAIIALGNFVSALTGITWEIFANAAVAAWDQVTGAIQRAIEKALEFIGVRQSAAKGGPVGGGGAGMAGGGIIGGRGTGTSDSNLAWVSRGEHIMPARAVAQPGVLAFLEALRRSGGNLRDVLDGLGRFALGGLVPRAVPAFAGGGAVGNMSHVTIQLPGLPPIAGLRASAEVIDELRKSAALAQVRSGGRKPSRYS